MSAARNASVIVAAIVWSSTMAAAAQPGKIGDVSKSCHDNWKFAKAHDTIPINMEWEEFVKIHCSPNEHQAAIASKTPSTRKHRAGVTEPAVAHVVPATPSDNDTMKPAADWTKIPVPTTDKRGRRLSPGQVTALKRVKQCAAEWRADRDAGIVAQNESWRQYWLSCKARLKSTRG